MAQLEGKIGLVFGVANKNSIAWAVAQAWHAAGATLVFTYQGERFKQKVEELVDTLGAGSVILPCDVTRNEDITSVFQHITKKFGRLDLLLHAVAFAPREALDDEFVKSGSTIRTIYVSRSRPITILRPLNHTEGQGPA